MNKEDGYLRLVKTIFLNISPKKYRDIKVSLYSTDAEGDLKETVKQIMLTLLSREKEVIARRFGLETGWARTLKNIGEEFSLSSERIRQIEAKALGKLCHPTRSKDLRQYLS